MRYLQMNENKKIKGSIRKKENASTVVRERERE
jgi:hypothetical protein